MSIPKLKIEIFCKYLNQHIKYLNLNDENNI